MNIPFNKPFVDDRELKYITQALRSGNLSGNKCFTEKVKIQINQRYPNSAVFLTPSCSASLEMGVMISGIKPGDEVIMPSYTFSSTANAVMTFGATPVFCEISQDTMNIDPAEIEKLITGRTKMIIPIDYGGVPCEMGEISKIAKKHGLIVMLDAAQSYGSFYHDLPTGVDADLVCFSFHETKNLSCGEGGALLVNREEWFEKAAFIQEKGTDRKKMLEGIQDRYSWISSGSSYILADILAAMLLGQIEKEEEITVQRKRVFQAYKQLFNNELRDFNLYTLRIEDHMNVNFHSFWFLIRSNLDRQLFMSLMNERGIPAYIGYVPLHSSKMGKQISNSIIDLPVTSDLASRIVRMPIYPQMTDEELQYIFRSTKEVLLEIFK